MFFTPAMVLSRIGKKVPMKTTKILPPSSMPNQRMASGIHASGEIGRNSSTTDQARARNFASGPWRSRAGPPRRPRVTRRRARERRYRPRRAAIRRLTPAGRRSAPSAAATAAATCAAWRSAPPPTTPQQRRRRHRDKAALGQADAAAAPPARSTWRRRARRPLSLHRRQRHLTSFNACSANLVSNFGLSVSFSNPAFLRNAV